MSVDDPQRHFTAVNFRIAKGSLNTSSAATGRGCGAVRSSLGRLEIDGEFEFVCSTGRSAGLAPFRRDRQVVPENATLRTSME
jgi:hypothetical protein